MDLATEEDGVAAIILLIDGAPATGRTRLKRLQLADYLDQHPNSMPKRTRLATSTA